MILVIVPLVQVHQLRDEAMSATPEEHASHLRRDWNNGPIYHDLLLQIELLTNT